MFYITFFIVLHIFSLVIIVFLLYFIDVVLSVALSLIFYCDLYYIFLDLIIVYFLLERLKKRSSYFIVVNISFYLFYRCFIV